MSTCGNAEGGKLSSNGLYWTDENGQIVLDGITGTLVVTEVETIPGYIIHEEARSQTVVVNPDDTQELRYYNDPIAEAEIIKVDAADRTKRLANATFEVREMDGGLVDTVTTDSNGRVTLFLEDGSNYAVEIEVPKGVQGGQYTPLLPGQGWDLSPAHHYQRGVQRDFDS